MKKYFVFICSLLALVIPVHVLAATPRLFNVTPRLWEQDNVDPGTTLRFVFHCNKAANEWIVVTLIAEDFQPDEEGRLKATTREDSLLDWVSFAEDEYMIEEGKWLDIQGEIVIPEDALPGTHYVKVIFQVQLENGSAIGTSFYPTSIIVLNINSVENIEALELIDFNPSQTNFPYGPIEVAARLYNSGTV